MRVNLYLVPGTWHKGFFKARTAEGLGKEPAWYQEDSPFRVGVSSEAADLPDVEVEYHVCDWSGDNDVQERIRLGDLIADQLKSGFGKHPDETHVVVAHSHGGNAALYCLDRLDESTRPHGIVTMGTPFLEIGSRKSEDHTARVPNGFESAPSASRVWMAAAPPAAFIIAGFVIAFMNCFNFAVKWPFMGSLQLILWAIFPILPLTFLIAPVYYWVKSRAEGAESQKSPANDEAAARHREEIQRAGRLMSVGRDQALKSGSPPMLILRANGDEASFALGRAQVAFALDRLRRNLPDLFFWLLLLAFCVLTFSGYWHGTTYALFTLRTLSWTTVGIWALASVIVLPLLSFDLWLLRPFGLRGVRFTKDTWIRATTSPTEVPTRYLVVPDDDIKSGLRHAVYNAPATHAELVRWVVSLGTRRDTLQSNSANQSPSVDPAARSSSELDLPLSTDDPIGDGIAGDKGVRGDKGGDEGVRGDKGVRSEWH